MNSRRLIIQQMEADSGRSSGKSKSNAATGKASGHFQPQKKKKTTPFTWLWAKEANKRGIFYSAEMMFG